MKKLVVVLAISSFLAIVAIAYAQGPDMMGEGSEMEHGMMGMLGKGSEMGPGMMGEHHILGILMTLGLDEKQKDAVKEIVRKTMKETIKRRADLDIARIDLRDLLDKDSVNMNAVESKLKQIASLEADIHLSRIKAHEEIKSKLTPDQRKKLKEVMEHGMMMGKMGMMQGKGCCEMMGGMKGGMMEGKGCGMMSGMKGGTMQHGNMETVTPPAEKSEEMPGMEHGH
jgi:Spy/CpxP family protein refolding chaperone